MKKTIKNLKKAGHSALTAHQIAADAMRGNGYALAWLDALGIDRPTQ